MAGYGRIHNDQQKKDKILATVDYPFETGVYRPPSEGGSAFIQDGNSMIMKPQDLVEALIHLKNIFPSISRITTYARARTIAQIKLN